MSEAIQIEGLGKTYRLGLRMRRVVALESLDLQVEEGSVFGFVGPNGAGKSTTIKILVGLVTPTTGHATLFGQRVPTAASRRAVGYPPREPFLLRIPPPARGPFAHGPPLRDEGSHPAPALRGGARPGWASTTPADLTVRKFSKGMVQRLGLAQAVLHDPPLLILDEPMSGLDPLGRAEVRDLT